MPLPSSPACQVCVPRTDVSPDKCSRCQVVVYCGREHQLSHFASHKTVCKEIKKNRDVMEERRYKVRNSLIWQYQEAYDFIKWWATTAQENYDFDNKELPYLDTHGADMTEELPDLNNHKVFFASCIVYIKMMLAKAVQETIVAYELTGQAPLPSNVAESLGNFLAP